MKTWQFASWNELGDTVVVTLTEQEILDQYWDHWYNSMCKKFGKEFVDGHYTHEECINDWVVVNWAWEVE